MHLKNVKIMNTENDIKMKELAEHFQKERPHLMRYACYRLGDTDDAKDALQDTFLKVSSKISDEKSVKVRDWRNYIFRVLSNLCSSRLTALGKVRTIPLDARLDIADLPTENYESDYQRIAKLLMEIPEEQAEVIRLRIYGSNSFADVAEILSLPLPTVKSRFLYGLEKIRKAMKQTNH